MKTFTLIALLLLSTGTFAEEKYCGKITHITLHDIDGRFMYNFGLDSGFLRGKSNSFAWLDSNDPREREILAQVKYAKANNFTICMEYGLPVDGKVSVE